VLISSKKKKEDKKDEKKETEEEESFTFNTDFTYKTKKFSTIVEGVL